VIDQVPLRGKIIINESLAKYTSWKVGGPADQVYRPVDIDDLSNFLGQLPSSEPVYWMGLGSNLLVRDKGIRGTVIMTSGLLNQLELVDELRIRVEVGVPCNKVAKYAAKANLVGVEFLAGIPGTMGGALAMNAGAFGGETWAHIETVEMLSRAGEKHLRTPDEFAIAYRSVHGPAHEWFVAATLKLISGEGVDSLQRIKKLLAKRAATQPTNLPSCGSVFRNPENADHAARLIETAGLKGLCVGGACVSEKHANFIINRNKATAADIEKLIEKVQSEVKKVHGICLIREVCIAGEALNLTAVEKHDIS